MSLRLKLILPVMGLALVSACATEQEMCISRAAKDLRVVERLIPEVETNIARGYALTTQQSFEQEFEQCGVGADSKPVYCSVMVPVTTSVPTAIDLDAERAKLNALLRKRDDLARSFNIETQNCRARYPE